MKKILICLSLLVVGCVGQNLNANGSKIMPADFSSFVSFGMVHKKIKPAPVTALAATPAPTATPAPMASFTGMKLRKVFQNVDANNGADAQAFFWNSLYYNQQILDFTTATTTGSVLIVTASPNRPVSSWSPNCHESYSFGSSTVAITDNCADTPWQNSNSVTASYRIQSALAVDGNNYNVLEIDRSGTSNYSTASVSYERFEICNNPILSGTLSAEVTFATHVQVIDSVSDGTHSIVHCNYLSVINEVVSMQNQQKVITLSSWKELDECALNVGDVVIHDLNGLGEPPSKIEGVSYYSHSGGAVCDFPKPWPIDEILNCVVIK
jgi:hypothetical protein